MFRAIYYSPWHNPFAYVLAAFAFLVVLTRTQPFFFRWCILFTAEIAADALLTGEATPVLPTHASWMPYVVLPFILLGDFRYFLLLERHRHGAIPPREPLRPQALLRALMFMLIVPCATYPIREVINARHLDARWFFLTYESFFLLLALGLRFVVLPARLRSVENKQYAQWLLALTHFEILQYALWILADVVLLYTAKDLGFALRLLPNVLYYVCFLPFAWYTAPAEERG